MSALSAIRDQDDIVALLWRGWSSGRLHHAHLFHGPAGTGKRTTAMALAARMVCLAPLDRGMDPCGVCTGCVKQAAGAHPDVLVVEPDGRQIRIEQVRDIQHATLYRPVEAPARVVLLREAHALREEAANALLKTLEEPTARTHFVLLTDQPQRLLDTIRSRCQPVGFGALRPATLRTLLLARHPEGPPLDRAVRLAQGSMREAERWLQSPVLLALDDWTARLLRILDGPPTLALDLADELAAQRAEAGEVLAWLRLWLRDGAMASAGQPDRVALAPQAARALADRLHLPGCLHGLQLVDESERLAAGNVNARMIWERLCLGLQQATHAPTAHA